MNRHFADFMKRGAFFGGFGPIIAGIVYLTLSEAITDFSLGGKEVFVAIISTYILAFIHAGVSVFHQIESWSLAKSLIFHLSSLYLAYTGCYLINSWIPFDIKVLIIFTAIFVVAYFTVWLIVVLSIKAISKHLSTMLK